MAAKKKHVGKAKKMSKKAANQNADPLAGSVDAIEALEALDGPLTFGGFLRAIREGEAQTLEQMAKVLEVSRHHLSDVELGRRTVSAARAAAWAEKLGYAPSQFVALALQAELDAAGLKLRVSVGAA
jgi:antitoxin HigA-1